MSIYVNGSEALELEPSRQMTREEMIRRERRRKAALARAEKERKKKRIKRGVALGAVILVTIAAVIINLNCTLRNSQLASEISSLESQYSDLKAQNDSKEYAINQYVDIKEVIKTATEELGMVRSSADQVISYKTDNSEYIQKVAELTED